MKPQYLNHTIRDAILTNALNGSAIAVARVKIEECFKTLADEIYKYATGGQDLQAYEEANVGFCSRTGKSNYVKQAYRRFSRQDYISVSLRGQTVDLYFRGDIMARRHSDFNNELEESRIGGAQLVYLDDDAAMSKMGELLFETIESRADYLSQRNALRVELKNVLDSARTVKKLIEIWPNVEKYLPENLKSLSAPQLPALNIAHLEALLNGTEN